MECSEVEVCGGFSGGLGDLIKNGIYSSTSIEVNNSSLFTVHCGQFKLTSACYLCIFFKIDLVLNFVSLSLA